MSGTQPERFISSRENGITPAGAEFLLGYLANRYPEAAAEALAALREYAADGPNPEFWVTEPKR